MAEFALETGRAASIFPEETAAWRTFGKIDRP